MTKVELFELIRKDYFNQEKSIRRIARDRSIHRRVVRQAIENALPPARVTVKRKCSVLTLGIKYIIDQIIREDQKAPRKQRHTSKRVFERLVEEHNYQGSLSSVSHYYGAKRRELGINSKAFVPQVYQPGDEAEVDWYEAMVDFPEGRKKVYFFLMRACYSGFEFHMAFERQNQQSFLEAHVAAFDYFGGVFKTIYYDNLTSAVKKVLKGRKRIETEKFIALRSHYLFESSFCLPGIEGAHEKGGVEGGVGRFRRSHLTPVPVASDIFSLHDMLLTAWNKDTERTIAGKDASVKERWEHEVISLNAIPNVAFDTAEVVSPKVSTKSLVSIKGNFYSVPVQYVGQSVEARVNAQTVTIYKQGKLIASHTRSYLHYKMMTELDHYLPLLKHKPGALSGSHALSHARQRSQWPEVYDRYWQALLNSYDKSNANRLFVEFLWWARDFDSTAIVLVLNKSLTCGSLHLDAIKVLMRQQSGQQSEVEQLDKEELGHLARYERPITTTDQYNSLLSGTGA